VSDSDQTVPPRPRFRDDVVAVEVDRELLLLDQAASTIVRLDAAATQALGRAGGPDADVLGALADLGLVADRTGRVTRRDVLRTTGLAGLGISVLALPAAASAVSLEGQAGEEPFALATGSVAALDTEVTGLSASVNAIVVQTDGKIVIGGRFTSVGGVTRNRVARIHPNGTVDNSFNPSASAEVFALAVQSDGRIVIGGQFTSVGGITRNRLARVHSNGTLDDLDLNLTGNANALAVQQVDGEEMILVGGAFANVGATPVRRLIRIREDDSLDPNMNAVGVGTTLYALAIDAQNRIIVGGAFVQFRNESGVFVDRAGIVRLTTAGQLDTDFPSLVANGAPIENSVEALAVDSVGRILLGGRFQTTFPDDTPARYIARMSAAGVPDPTFDPDLNGNVRAITVQTDGRAVIGGEFTTIDDTTRNRIARLHADTAGVSFLDTTFDPNADGTVNALAMQANGRIVLGGAFNNVGGQPRSKLARLD